MRKTLQTLRRFSALCYVTLLIACFAGTEAYAVPIPGITATISGTAASCNATATGSATVTVTTGVSPYNYSWAPSGGSGATASGLAAGTYSCTITDATSASIVKTISITEPVALSVSGTASFCTTTTLTPSMSGGTWSSGNTSVATVNASGVVTGVVGGTATISYVHTCSTATQTVTVNLPNPGVVNGLQTVCVTAFIAHSSTGTAGGTWVSSNTAVGTINPSTGTMGGASNGTTTISYTVTNGCGSTTATVVNTVYALTDPGTISGPSSVCTGNTVSMSSSSTTTSSPPYSHAWSSSATAIATVNASTGVVTGMSAGTSRISYTATGCGTFRTFFTMNVLPSTVSAISGTTTVAAGASTTLSSATSGGSWSSTNTAVGTINSSGVVTGISGGTTTISYLLNNVCGTAVATTNVTVFAPLSATISQSDVSCFGGSTGSATVTASGGTAPYGYSWAPSGGTDAVASGLAAGTYSCTITDAASASVIKTVTITEPAALSLTGTASFCTSTTLTPSMSGGSWSSSNTSVATVNASGVVTGVVGGTATISYVHTCSTATQTVTVNLPNPGVINGLQTVCVTAFIAHSSTGTAGGTWVSSNTAVGTINPSTGTMGGASNGTTTVSYTVTNGCGSATATIVNTVYALTDPGTISGPSTVCTAATITMSSSSTTTSSPPYSHAWSSSATAIATVNASTGVVTGMSGGTSRISYTATGCGTFRTFFTVNVLPVPTVSAISGTTTVAMGSSTSLSNTTSGGSWSSINTAVGSVDGSGNVTGISLGTTTISYLVSNSCGTAVATTNVTVISSFDATTDQTNVACFGGNTGSATVTVSGGTAPFNYSWEPSGGSGATASDLAAGTYTCTVTDAASSTIIKTVTITQPGAMTSSASVTNVYCYGNSTGAISVTAGGGVAPYGYSWAPAGGTAATATGLAAGAYTCTITDNNGCTKTQTATVSQPSSVLNVSLSSQTNVSCNGLSNGAATVSVTGGTPFLGSLPTSSYMYSWAPSGGSSATASGLAAGTYTCTITDARGCTATQTVTITQPTVLASSVSSLTNVSCNGATDGAATVSVSGGTTPYFYSWTPAGGESATAGSLAAGNYSCTITDANGCTKLQTVIITQPTAVTISTATNNGPVCYGSTLSFNGAASGGTGEVSYNWAGPGDFSSTMANPSVSSATTTASGSYTLTATDGNGCSATATTSAVVNPMPSAIGGSLNVCAGLNTTLFDATEGGTWSSSNTDIADVSSTGVVMSNVAGTVNITYTLPSGCYTVSTITVNTFPSVITGTTAICSGNTVTLGNDMEGGLWSSSNSAIATVNASTGVVTSGATAGTATITYTSDKGCSVTKMVYNAMGAITGSNGTCIGLTTTLADATTGGTWSSSNTDVATIGSTGIVSALAGGSATITYASGSCYRTLDMNMSTTPSVITGGGPVCVGNTLTLADVSSGGTWSCMNPELVTLVPQSAGSAAVIAVVAGNATVTYSLSTTCKITTNITVNPLPSYITGTLKACPGTSTTLVDTSGIGYWASGNTSVATINASTGVASGITMGTSLVTFAFSSTGCQRTAILTINPTPSAITGTTTVCQGSTTALANSTGGGLSWTSSNTAVATVNASSGVVTGVAAGTANITYTVSTGCFVTTMVSVTALPGTISGVLKACVGGSTSLSNSITGGSWAVANTAIATITTDGVITGVAQGTTSVTYTVPGGCIKTGVVTINPNPSAIAGTKTVCAGSVTTLSSSGVGTWSSDNTAVGSVATNGAVTGISGGTATVSYTFNTTGCYSSAVVTVNALPSAIGGTFNVCVGATTSLTDADADGTWSSSMVSAATIGSSSGIVTGVGAGTSRITYTLPTGCRTTQMITVNATPAAIGGSMGICLGAVTTLTDATTGGTWSSSDPATASVASPSSGAVTGNVAGTATISYTLSTGCYKTAMVTVSSLSAITGTASVCVGAQTTLAAGTGGTWSSSNAGVATVGTAGNVTGVAAGTAYVTYTLAGGCRATRLVTVSALPNTIAGVSTLCELATATLTNSTSGGTWSSSNTATATIDAATGVVSGLVAGTTSIVYTNAAGCSRATTITVNPNPASISGVAAVGIGSTMTLSDATTGGTWSSSFTSTISVNATSGVVTGTTAGTAVVTYTLSTGCKATAIVTINGAPAAISGSSKACIGSTSTLGSASAGGTWSSSNTAVGTVDASGVVTGISIGTTTISYVTGPGAFVTTVFTVNALPAAIAGVSEVCAGSAITLTDATGGGQSWSSSNTSVASVVLLAGVVTGVAAGTVDITYTLNTGCYTTKTITVNPIPAAIGGSGIVCTGGAAVTLTDADAGGTWLSSAPAYATVGSSSGIVTGIAIGNPKISYILPTGCYVYKTMTVNTAPAAITGTGAVCVGSVTSLSNSGGGTWSSSNAAVGTVALGNGATTGISAGTTTISYTTSNGCSVTKDVTVNAVPGAPTTTPVVCKSATVTLTNALAGGTWTSANTSYATIGAATGVLTGVGNGTVRITYTLNGCYNVSVATINATPGVISGSNAVCSGSVITLNAASSGGTWSSSNAAVGTIGSISSSSARVVGISGGNITITYTGTNACFTTYAVTVNATPSAGSISGSNGFMLHTVSAPTSTTLSSTGASGGTWTSSAAGVASVNASTGLVTAVSAGNATVTYTVTSGSCSASATQTINVTAGRPGSSIGTSTETATNINLFPNPNKGDFFLKGTMSATDGDATMEVVNMTGQVIFSGKVTISNGNIEEHIQLTNGLTNGMYLLTIRTGEESKVFHFVIAE